jgi:hypothetical protein
MCRSAHKIRFLLSYYTYTSTLSNLIYTDKMNMNISRIGSLHFFKCDYSEKRIVSVLDIGKFIRQLPKFSSLYLAHNIC